MLLQEARTNFHAHDKSVIPNYGRNKGKRGQGIEKLCGKDLCSGLLDFDDGEGKSHKEGQTIFVTQLQHCLPEIFDRSISYSQSKVGRKLENVWFIKFSKSGEYVNDLIFNAEKYISNPITSGVQHHHVDELANDLDNYTQALKAVNEDYSNVYY